MKVKKTEKLILIFQFFSAISLIVGVFLFSNFFNSIQKYYTFRKVSFISIPDSWQDSDFLTVMFSFLWIFLSIFLFFAVQQLKIKVLKEQLSFEQLKPKNNFEIFEIKFQKLLNHKKNIIENIQFEYVENENIKILKADDFLFFIASKITKISENNFDFFKQKKEGFETLFFDKKMDKIELEKKKVLFLKKLFEVYHFQLNEYVEIVKNICDLLYDFEQENGSDSTLFLDKILILKNQFSTTEKDIILMFEMIDEKIKFYNLKYKISKLR